MRKADYKKTGQEAVAYIGPSFYGIVEKNTVFCSGLPPRLKKLSEELPFIQELLVPVSGLARARKELQTLGSEKQILYQRAVEKGGKHV
ncbi:hypothetical protein [Otoolea muris]|uniref:hypothetical protein n=1 Tax=Otoolea muris TaxID=2941515 RepID=UPI00203F921E|nr:hypothetical protein [Otoolea muris]